MTIMEESMIHRKQPTFPSKLRDSSRNFVANIVETRIGNAPNGVTNDAAINVYAAKLQISPTPMVIRSVYQSQSFKYPLALARTPPDLDSRIKDNFLMTKKNPMKIHDARKSANPRKDLDEPTSFSFASTLAIPVHDLIHHLVKQLPPFVLTNVSVNKPLELDQKISS